jgi:hypothetical protein
MPEFTVKEVRLPELHLPEIKRDDIVRSLSGVRLPDVDLAKARPVRVKMPPIAVSSSDLGRLVAAGIGIARLARPTPRRGRTPRLPFARGSLNPVTRLVRPRTRRSRWPMVVVVVVVGAVIVAAWALLRQPSIRRRVDEMARDARERWATMRTLAEQLEIDTDEPVAINGIETPSTEAAGFVDANHDAGPMTPIDVDADVSAASAADGDGVAAFEEAGKPI